MTWKIVADSGCDVRQIKDLAPDTEFINVPLTITIDGKDYIDNEELDAKELMEVMSNSKEAATSACPSPDAFLQAYKGVDNVIAITITGGLSGSQNSAQLAKNLLLEESPNANIHVIDSLSAGGEIDLIVYEINRLITQGLSFEEVVKEITEYQKRTQLLFVLAKVDNLVKNGRLNKIVGKVIGMLNIRLVGAASEKGDLEVLEKPRGQKKAVAEAYKAMLNRGYNGGKVVVAHNDNEKICQQISDKILADFPGASIELLPTSGLCSFYGEVGGILLGYETK